MPQNNETTTKFKVDISELKSGIRDASRQIRLANAEFKAAASGMDDWQNSADGVSAKIASLDKVLANQNKILSAYKQQLAVIVDEQGENSKAADDMRIKIANQQAAVNKTEKELNGYKSTLEGLESGEIDASKAAKGFKGSVDEVGKAAGKSTDGFTVMKGALADLVATGIKAAINGLKDLASASYEAWQSYDEGVDNIIKATGATGESAKALEESFKTVSSSIVADSSDIGSAIGEVNTRFGLTGDDLENLSTKFLKFADLNGTDVVSSVDNVQKALSAYGLSAEDAGALLDTLNATGQATGASVDTLAQGLVTNATAFQELGLSIDQASVLMGQLEMSGADASTVMGGLKRALKNAAAEGVPFDEALANIQDEISNSENSVDGLNAAYELFGRSGDQIYNAVKNGALDFKALSGEVEDFGGSVENTFEGTLDAPDKFMLSIQKLKTSLAEMAGNLMTEYGPAIEKAFDGLINTVIPKLEQSVKWFMDNLPTIEALIVGIGTAFGVFKAVALVQSMVKAFVAWRAATEGMTIAQAALNAVMSANPIGLIISAVAGLVAAFVILWNKSEKFRKFWINLWTNIKKAVSGVVNWIKNNWKNMITFLAGPLGPFVKLVIDNFDKIKDVAGKTWDKMKSGAKGAWDGIKSAFGHVGDWFHDKFANAWERVKAVFSVGGKIFAGIKEGITAAFKVIVNGIIRGLNTIIAKPFNDINAILDKLRNLEIAGVRPFSKLAGRLTVPQIPEIPVLATGGVLKKGQVGLLEGKGAEAVVPLDRNKKWIAATAESLRSALTKEGVIAQGAKTSTVNNNYTFNQNNTSPKALSRLEIYRQTRNQLALAKGV